MKVKDYRRKIQELIFDLPAEAERLCVVQALSGLTIVKNRSINKGIFFNSEEGNYVKYSQNEIPSFFFAGRERNARGAKHITENRLTTWQAFREAQGLKSENMNFSYTNRMWTSLGIIKQVQIDNGVIVVIGSTDPKVDEYLPYLRRFGGNFINPTKNEQVELTKDTTVDLLKFVKDRI